MSTTTTDIPNMLRNKNKKRQQRHYNPVKTIMNSLNNFGLVGGKFVIVTKSIIVIMFTLHI